MQNLEDADVVGEFSALKPFGNNNLFRILDVLKGGRILETEVEVLRFRSDPAEAHASLDQHLIIGKAVISTSLSRHWEATIELMQAKTNERFHNVQIFAGLLRCIRKICIERLIGHLAIVDIGDASQKWYRDFFRLAGFHPCHCQNSTGSTVQPEPRNCLALTESLDQEFSTVHEIVRIWLAEDRCTWTLLDSAAGGEAAKVEHRYFHDLIAVFGNGEVSQSAREHTEIVARDRTRSQRPWQKFVKMTAAPRRKALEPGTESRSSRNHRPNKEAVVKSIGGSASRVRKKRKRI